jgi:hypothetical protein
VQARFASAHPHATAARLLHRFWVNEFRIFPAGERNNNMSIGTILIIILILALIGALPTWPYSSGWGYYPSGGVGLLVLILVILLLMGRL